MDPMTAGDAFVAIGTILKPHGIHGEMRVRPLSSFPERFQALKEVYLRGGMRCEKFVVAGVRPHKQFLLVKLEGVRTLEEAEAWRGADLAVPPDQVWAHGVLAMARLWNGQPEQAREAAAASQALILKTQPNAFYALEGYAGVAEVGISLWDTDAAEVKAAAKAARASLKGLKQFAAFFPIGIPRAYLWEGMYHWKLGKRSKAHAMWQKGLALAQANRFAYEEALLRRVIATHMEASDPARVPYFQRAVELFASIGATRDAALSRSALGS